LRSISIRHTNIHHISSDIRIEMSLGLPTSDGDMGNELELEILRTYITIYYGQSEGNLYAYITRNVMLVFLTSSRASR